MSSYPKATLEATLGEHLAATGQAVPAEAYEAIRSLPPRQGASWALWGSSTGDLSIFDEVPALIPRLRRDVVLIGANFGIGAETGTFRAFQNFHSRTSRGDTKLRNAVTGTELEGAFLTDLVKDYPTKYANDLVSRIESGSIDTERHVAWGSRAEQDALGLTESTLYIPMGINARNLWDVLVVRGVIPRSQRVFHREYGAGPTFRGRPVRNLTHYSASGNMADAVRALLAQRPLPAPRPSLV